MQYEVEGLTLDLVMTLEVDVCKVDYKRDGVLGLIMMFGICKMRISDQGDKLVDRQVDRI